MSTPPRYGYVQQLVPLHSVIAQRLRCYRTTSHHYPAFHNWNFHSFAFTFQLNPPAVTTLASIAETSTALPWSFGWTHQRHSPSSLHRLSPTTKLAHLYFPFSLTCKQPLVDAKISNLIRDVVKMREMKVVWQSSLVIKHLSSN